jgi:hypothetical protein
MPDFTEILKIAVEQQDWKIICGLYENITGETIRIPSETESNPTEDQSGILQKEYSMEEILPEKETSEVDQEEESVYNEFTAPTKVSEPASTGENRRMRSEPVGKKFLGSNFVGVSTETFVDDMTDDLIDPETGEKLVGNNANVKITPRNKRKELGMNDTSLIETQCSVCEKTFNISTVLSHGFSAHKQENTWKCNDCNTRKSKRNRER